MQVAGAAGAATALMTYATIVNPHETAVVSFPRSSAFIAYLAASVFAAFTGPQKKSAIWAHVGGICGALFGAAFAGALFYLIFKGATELIVLFTLVSHLNYLTRDMLSRLCLKMYARVSFTPRSQCPVALLMFAVSGALSDSSLGQPVRASLPADSPSALLPGIGAVPVRMMRELKRMRFALDEAESTLADVRGELARLAKDGSKEGIEKLRAFASSQGSIEKLCAPGEHASCLWVPGRWSLEGEGMVTRLFSWPAQPWVETDCTSERRAIPATSSWHLDT